MYIHTCVWIWNRYIYVHIHGCLWFQGGKDEVYTAKLKISNTYGFHCPISSHSYPAHQSSCTAQVILEHQYTGEVSSPGPQVFSSLCSKLCGTWTVEPAGLICGQDCGYDPVLPSPMVMAQLALSFWVVLCLSVCGLTHVNHYHKEERHMGFKAGEGLQVIGILSCNLLILPFFVITRYTFNIYTDVCGNVNSVVAMYC